MVRLPEQGAFSRACDILSVGRVNILGIHGYLPEYMILRYTGTYPGIRFR